VSLFTRPGGARIQVDGAFVGRTPIDSLPLSGGSHVLQAELPEYAPLSIRHVVPPGRRDTVWLELASSLSLLSLVTTPEHSTVSIDGGEPLMCPLWRHQVSEGLHVLSIHLPDLDTPVLRDIYVVSGYQVNVEAGGTVFSPGTMLTSLLVPGLGQIIERSYLKGALELAFAAGSIVFLSESVSYRNEKNSQFELTKSQYRVASTEQAAILARTNLELAASSLNRANDRLAVARIIVAGAYALSLVDALLNYTFRRDIVTVKSSEIRRELSVTLTFPF
jgi:hypothetical protein